MSVVVRVVLVDDHPTVRAGVGSVLTEGGFVVVAECDSPAAALREVLLTAPDLVVLDIGLGTESGMTVLPELASSAYVLVHSMYTDLAQEVLRLGARGFVPKNAPADCLLSAAREIVAGRRYVEPNLAADVASAGGPERISPRERRVLVLLADGYTNREIAGLLALSVRTVESARAQLRSRLGLVTRADMVAYVRPPSGGGG